MSAFRIYMLGVVCTAVYGCLSAVTNDPEKPVTPPVVIDQPAPAVGQPQEQPVSTELTNEQIVQTYADNETAIRDLWLDLGDRATMRDAVLEWLKRNEQPDKSEGDQSEPAESAAAAPDKVSAETQMVAALNDEAPYGYCPDCGAPGKYRERRINGNDTCERGHKYPSASALDFPPVQSRGISKQSAPGCTCPGDCCKCDPSKVPHYWHSGKWHPCKVMTVEDAERENASLVPMRAAQPVQQSQPIRQEPVTIYRQPVTAMPMFQSGGCANGQCGVGTSRRIFGRR